MGTMHKYLLMFLMLAIVIGLFIMAGCGHTQATRKVVEHEDGSEEIIMTLNRLDSKACIDGDCISTKNASWFDRLWKIPQLVLFQMGGGAAATD